MRQPVSRISFDRRRGFVGVQLQEGAPFVDAAWNEGSDIAWSLLRDAIVAGGIAGTSGRELRIDPIEDPSADPARPGRLRNLIVRGGDPAQPRPFYCDGLPVLWLADLPIDAQPIGDAFRGDATGATHVPPGGTWIDLLQDQAYEVFLRAWIDTLDRLDDPMLDDPALDAARGTFRKRIVSEVRIRKAGEPPLRTASNLRLSVDGSYRSELNVLYRVELVALTGRPGAPAASVLWDPDAAATVARVVDAAPRFSRDVMVDTTDGFDAGFVRFEGPGVAPDLYRVTRSPDRPGAAIQVTRHRCDRDEVSLAAWQPSGAVESLPPDRFRAAFLVPAPVQAGDVLRSLPSALHVRWNEATVVAVAQAEPDRKAVTLTLIPSQRDAAPGRALSIADWEARGPAVQNTDGTYTAVLVPSPVIAAGDVVTALPPALGTPTTGPWVALDVAPIAAPVTAPAEPAAPPDARPRVAITFGPAGLAEPLATLDLDRKAALREPARQFDTTIVVDDRADWQVGMRISLVRPGEPAAATDAAGAAREDRAIARIERLSGATRPHGAPPTMIVRLDQPLAYDHATDVTIAVPERRIRARRFAGHACRLGIDRVDPAHDGVASLANFAAGQPLPDGLALHLTVEHDDKPWIRRGDGWQFAARSDGFYETRLFAPVEDEPASEVALARLTVSGSSYELIDLRPQPAGLAVDDELVRIAEAAASLAGQLGDDPATHLLVEIARLAGHARVQPALAPRLTELARSHRTRLYTSAAGRPWLERLDRAVEAIAAGAEPVRRQLAAISFAIGGLAFAFAAERPPSPPPAPPPTSPPPQLPGTTLAGSPPPATPGVATATATAPARAKTITLPPPPARPAPRKP